MDDSGGLLMAAMASKCREIIRGSNEEVSDLPEALHPRHLLWMCDQIESNPQSWPVVKQQRWIGFIQAAILANRILDLEQTREMFAETTKTHRVGNDDPNLVDHLDVGSSFNLELGGSG